MEFETLPPESGATIQLVIIGMIVLACLGMAAWVFLWLLKFQYFRLAMLYSPVIVLISWFTGYCVSRADAFPRKCKCSYEFNFFWTEWLHKRKCLAYTLNGKR